MDKSIFYDSDVLICFLAINQGSVLKNIFSKVIIPEPVYNELINMAIYQNIGQNLNFLINDGFVEIGELDFSSPEWNTYNLIRRGFWTDGNMIGRGESAARRWQLKIMVLLQAIILVMFLKFVKIIKFPLLQLQ